MKIYPTLEIPETLAAGPGPGNTDPRVLERFAKTGVADHMQKDVLRGMLEAKEMLRELWGTKNVYTYGVAGTGRKSGWVRRPVPRKASRMWRAPESGEGASRFAVTRPGAPEGTVTRRCTSPEPVTPKRHLQPAVSGRRRWECSVK